MAGLVVPVVHFRFVILLLAAGGLVGAAWAQGNTAVVTGVEHVFIRRGPGTEFPPFATLMEGSTVEVQEMHGEWARVLTTNGQSGYVKSNFLSLPGERPAAPAAAAAVPAPAVPAPTKPAAPTPAPARPQAAAVQALTEQNQNLAAQVAQLQGELLALKAQAEATTPTVPTPAADAEQLRGELTRLNAAVDQLQHRLEAQPPRLDVSPLPNLPAEGPVHVVTSTAILLAAIGLCLGWLLGSAFGRRQERGRRPRVRL